jgi:hypothetical protein
MAISQVTKGVFVVSPDQRKRYQDTAAGQYTSVFTKNRADQWEMAQKQSLMEMELGSKRWATEMELYKRRIEDLNARAKAIESAIADAGGDNAKLAQAAKIAAERENTDRMKEEARRDEARAEVMNRPVGGGTSTTTKPPSTSTSTSTGGSGSGGPKAAKVGAADAAEIGGAVRTGGGSATATAGDVERRKAAGTIVGKTGDDAVAVNAAAVQAMIEDRAGKGVTRDEAERQVLTELQAGDFGQYVSDYGAHMDAQESSGGGPRTTVTNRPGSTSTTVRSGGGSVSVPKRPDLGVLDLPESAITPEVIDIAALIKQREALDAERKGLLPPNLPDMDYITRARGIMAGRFGPTPVQPAPAYAQRNALAYLASAPKDVVQAAYQEYLKTLPPQTPPTAEAPALTPMQKQQQDVAAARASGILAPNAELDALLNTPPPSADGLRAPVVQESLAARMFRERSPTFGQGGTAESAPPIGINVPPPPEMGTKPEPVDAATEKKRRTLGDILLRGFKPEYDRTTGELIAPNLTGPERAEAIQGIDMQSPGRQSRLFPESMLPPYPREVNGQSFRPLSYAETRDPEGERTLQEQRIALESMFPEGVPPQFSANLAPPPRTPPPRMSTMTAPNIQAEPAPAIPRTSLDTTPPELGEKPMGEIPVYPEAPGMAPAADRPPLKAARPVMPAGATGRAENAMGAAKRVADIKVAAKAGIGGETAGVGAKKNPTAENYLFYRMESALELSKKDDKLRRIIASGPGKIANDLYVANKSKGIPFNKTWEEITMTFAQDKEGMSRAHEVALALDMKATDQKTPKE